LDPLGEPRRQHATALDVSQQRVGIGAGGHRPGQKIGGGNRVLNRQIDADLAAVSISLGILNLLPIPLLDGGQIVYQLAEAVKGAPLSERAMVIGQQIGIFFVIALTGFAFYNDIVRLFGS
jgi:hypothetical protein